MKSFIFIFMLFFLSSCEKKSTTLANELSEPQKQERVAAKAVSQDDEPKILPEIKDCRDLSVGSKLWLENHCDKGPRSMDPQHVTAPLFNLRRPGDEIGRTKRSGGGNNDDDDDSDDEDEMPLFSTCGSQEPFPECELPVTCSFLEGSGSDPDNDSCEEYCFIYAGADCGVLIQDFNCDTAEDCPNGQSDCPANKVCVESCCGVRKCAFNDPSVCVEGEGPVMPAPPNTGTDD